ncbi:hypothetical protein Glove_199g131 [Diversispora epigaea]|uniref:Uncharacterized protein n=1 Tax=Diversispora epigaea TaxID=1348612 RepID=A0A397IJV7_9GLOM|nr:hypothetical protein Glove_199g131 [Diversispora epigaea]
MGFDMMDDAKLFILQNYYIDEEAKELGFKQLVPNLTHCTPIRKKTQEYLPSKIANPKIKEVIKTSNIVTVEKTTKNAKFQLSSNVAFQHEGGLIIQTGDSETEKELLEVIDNVCAWIEKYDKEQKYLLAQFGDEKITKKTKKKTAALQTNLKPTKNHKSVTSSNDLITSAQNITTNTNGKLKSVDPSVKRILDDSNNYVIDELTREDSDEKEDSDDDLGKMDKKYLTQKYDFTHLVELVYVH